MRMKQNRTPPHGSETSARIVANTAVITPTARLRTVHGAEGGQATMKDELDEFMTALEDIGVLTGWKEFMHGDDEKEKEDTTDD